jgi:hypothetical protein
VAQDIVRSSEKKINLVVAQGIERSSEMKKVAGAPGRGIYIHDE